jgi:hypothetical protein
VLPRPVSRNMLLRSIDSALKHHALLRARPSLLQRHKVEAVDDIRIDSRAAGRVRSYLDRLRGRPAPV